MIIHFSHANGFPSSCYRKFFSYLATNYQINYIDALGHDEQYPVIDNWPYQVQELIDYIEQHYSEPIIGMGHSLGGTITYIAAQQRPELFKALILLEPPMFNRIKAAGIGFAKRLKFIHKITIGGQAARRRQEWKSIGEALHYFQQKSLFKKFDPDCLQDYVIFGTVPTEKGIKLKINPEVEQALALTLPHRLPPPIKNSTMPILFFYGADSELYNHYDRYSFRHRYGAQIIKVAGGHLFPLEYPQETAAAIKSRLLALCAKI